MTNEVFNKKFDARKLLLELYNHNQYLQLQVDALTGMAGFALRRSGMTEKEIEKLGLQLIEQNRKRAEAPGAKSRYSERWAEILGGPKDE